MSGSSSSSGSGSGHVTSNGERFRPWEDWEELHLLVAMVSSANIPAIAKDLRREATDIERHYDECVARMGYVPVETYSTRQRTLIYNRYRETLGPQKVKDLQDKYRLEKSLMDGIDHVKDDWTKIHEQRLVQMKKDRVSYEEIAKRLNRTVNDVKGKLLLLAKENGLLKPSVSSTDRDYWLWVLYNQANGPQLNARPLLARAAPPNPGAAAAAAPPNPGVAAAAAPPNPGVAAVAVRSTAAAAAPPNHRASAPVNDDTLNERLWIQEQTRQLKEKEDRLKNLELHLESILKQHTEWETQLIYKEAELNRQAQASHQVNKKQKVEGDLEKKVELLQSELEKKAIELEQRERALQVYQQGNKREIDAILNKLDQNLTTAPHPDDRIQDVIGLFKHGASSDTISGVLRDLLDLAEADVKRAQMHAIALDNKILIYSKRMDVEKYKKELEKWKKELETYTFYAKFWGVFMKYVNEDAYISH